MALDNKINVSNRSELENKLQETIDWLKKDTNDLANDIIKGLNEDQLKQFIEKSFKKENWDWLSYSEMKKNPFYTFMIQSSLDLISDKIWEIDINWTKKTFDSHLWSIWWIDNKYGSWTSNAIKAFQKKSGLSVDGIAWKDFFKKICDILNWNNNPTTKIEWNETKTKNELSNFITKRWERWNEKTNKYEKYEELCWFSLNDKDLKFQNLYIFGEKWISTPINVDISWVFIKLDKNNNICINNQFCLHPSWAMSTYQERQNLNLYIEKFWNSWQDTSTKSLYDYLYKNKEKYEYKYISEQIIANGNGQSNNSDQKSTPDYSDIGMHKETDKNWKTIWVSDRIIPH